MNNMVQNFNVFSSSWLHDVRDGVIDKLRELADQIDLRDQDVVYAEGVEQQYLWGVVRGEVRVHVAMNEMEPTLGHIHRPGAWLGESEPILGIPGIVEMRAAGDTTMARIAYPRFRALANKNPELWEALTRLTSMNQLLAMSAANDLALRTGRKRLAAALLRLSGHRGVLQGSHTTTNLKVTQQEIAGLANLARSKTANHLASLADEKLIQLEYSRISILDISGLREIITN